MQSRVEVNDIGDFFMLLPDELVEELVLEEGEKITIELGDGMAELYFG